MRNPLQEQLLKAGLAKKSQVDAAARDLERQRDGKKKASAEQVSAQQLQAERAERDRALAAERNAQARAKELQAQVRQIVDNHKVRGDGEVAYRFVDGDRIRDMLVSEAQRRQLAKGALAIVQHDQGYALIPRAAAGSILERGAKLVVDHRGGQVPSPTAADEDAEYYKKFVVPDDLIW